MSGRKRFAECTHPKFFLASYRRQTRIAYKIIRCREILEHRANLEISVNQRFLIEIDDEWSYYTVLQVSDDLIELKRALYDHNMQLQYTWKYPIRQICEHGNCRFILGPNGTTISKFFMSLIKWDNYKVTTSALLFAVFSQKVLASCCFHGLDKKKTDDIILIVNDTTRARRELIIEHIKLQCKMDKENYRRTNKKEWEA